MSYFTGGGECLGQYECPTLHMGWKMFRVMSIGGGECRCDERRTILWDIKFFYISVFWSIHIQYQIIGLIRIELKENYTTLYTSILLETFSQGGSSNMWEILQFSIYRMIFTSICLMSPPN